MTREMAKGYVARIGGIIYKNVENPIIFNEKPILFLTRNPLNGELDVSFDLVGENGDKIATIIDSAITQFDSANYLISEGTDRIAIVDRVSGRIWADIRKNITDEIYELDISFLLIIAGVPIILHPNRTKIGKMNDNEPPNISSLTLTTEHRGTGTAIHLESSPLYLIDVAIEEFKTGISIKA